MNDAERLKNRYERIVVQLAPLLQKTGDPTARMATTTAVLHHKMPQFFWTGFYRVEDEALVVGPYQGPLACSVLKKPEGVCWAAVLAGKTVIVPDVEAFPGHIACDSRSRSEIAVPFRDGNGCLVGVLDVDSVKLGTFGETDREGLETIVALIHANREGEG